jgi:hypothetical protein
MVLAQAQVTFWKKWEPNGEEHTAALGKLKQAKASILASKSLDQQAQSLSDQLGTQLQKYASQTSELKQLDEVILDASDRHSKFAA